MTKTLADVQAAAAHCAGIEAAFRAKLREIQAQQTDEGPFAYVMPDARLIAVRREYCSDSRLTDLAAAYGFRVVAMP
jgi:transposase-like protein